MVFVYMTVCLPIITHSMGDVIFVLCGWSSCLPIYIMMYTENYGLSLFASLSSMVIPYYNQDLLVAKADDAKTDPFVERWTILSMMNCIGVMVGIHLFYRSIRAYQK